MDKDKYLIALWQEIQAHGLKNFPPELTREMWDSRKSNQDQDPIWLTGLVKIFASYFNRGWSGGYCLNCTDRDAYRTRKDRLREQLEHFDIGKVNFIYGDILLLPDVRGAMVYIDPPYQETKKYDVSKDFNHEALWEKVRKLSRDNIVVVSEQKAPEDFKSIWSMETKRNIGFHSALETMEHLWVFKGD